MELHKLAKELNLSRSTITQLLCNEPEDHEDYKRIVKAMKQLGIELSEKDKIKYAHRTKTIGVISRDLTETFFIDFVDAIQGTADQLGYAVVFVRQHIYTKQNIDYIKLLDEKVDGFIFLGEETSRHGEVETLMDQGVPCILIQGSRNIEGATYLNVNNEQASYNAMTHLAKQNHKRIIHITGPMNLYEVGERKKGYERAVLELGLDYQHTIHIEMDYDRIFDLGAMIGNRIRSDRITGAFCYNNLIATGIIDGLTEQGVMVPEDFSVIGFDDLSFRHMSRNWIPNLSSVKQPQGEMAKYAVEKLTEMMEGSIFDASRIFDCQFIDRDSTRYL